MRPTAILLGGLALVPLGEAFGYLRAGIGVAFFLLVVGFGFRYWRDVGSIPPETATTDVTDQILRYVCRVCGLQLRVEVAAKERPPTHCGEPMELIDDSGRAPLRPA